MAKKMEAGQTQTLKKLLHYMKPYRFFLLLSVILAAKMCIRDRLKEDKSCIRVNDRNIEKYLGKPRFHSLKANQTDEIGIVRGLAWTSVGDVYKRQLF